MGEGQTGKMPDGITALAVQVAGDARRSVLVDLLTVYGEGGKAIVFTQTKREADEVAASVGGHLPCGALHGDMSQREREKCLSAFRDKKVRAGAAAAGAWAASGPAACVQAWWRRPRRRCGSVLRAAHPIARRLTRPRPPPPAPPGSSWFWWPLMWLRAGWTSLTSTWWSTTSCPRTPSPSCTAPVRAQRGAGLLGRTPAALLGWHHPRQRRASAARLARR